MRDMREHAKKLHTVMRCNCDLDSWQPEAVTGHSWVCRIHKALMPLYFYNDEAFERGFSEIMARAQQGVQATRLSPSNSQALGDNPPSA